MLLTFALVCLAWIFFRAESLVHALDYISQIASNFYLDLSIFRKSLFLVLGISGMLIIEWIHRDKQHGLQMNEKLIPSFARRGIYLLTGLSILLFSPKQSTMFIYFQF